MTAEPRSVRLTKAHRDNITSAVMEEWTRQNPRPAGADTFQLLKAIADQVKQHPAYKRTQRFLQAMGPEDVGYVEATPYVNIAIINPQGEHRNTLQVVFPDSVAKQLGLVGLPSQKSGVYSDNFSPAELEEHDLVHTRGDPDVDMSSTDRMHLPLRCIQFADRGRITVQLRDDDAANVARQAARKANKEWGAEYRRLAQETRDLLDNFNSTKQLRDGWPAIVPYLPPHIADPERAVTLPVLATSRLNERLGLA